MQPDQPVQTSVQPVQPVQTSVQPVQPVQTSVQPDQPVQTSVQPVQPVQTSVQPDGVSAKLDAIQNVVNQLANRPPQVNGQPNVQTIDDIILGMVK